MEKFTRINFPSKLTLNKVNYILKPQSNSIGIRIDIFIQNNLDNTYGVKLSRNFIHSNFNVLLNNKVKLKKSYRIKSLDYIYFSYDYKSYNYILSSNIEQSVPIIHESDDFIVLNKPFDMVVHPSRTYLFNNTLLNFCLDRLSGFQDIINNKSNYSKLFSILKEDIYFNKIIDSKRFLDQDDSNIFNKCIEREINNYLFRIGIVHRLDRHCSGLIIVAKSFKSHFYFTNLFKNRSITKKYIAIVKGIVHNGGTINTKIGRDSKRRFLFSAANNSINSKTATTIYQPISYCKISSMNRIYECTVLDISIITGRTHQIRVHLSSIGHPIVGDVLYDNKEGLRGDKFKLGLAAIGLKFSHPMNNKEYKFSIDLPDHMQFYTKNYL